jgi:hypothetical protein
MKTRTFAAFAAGLVVGLLAASASGVRFGGPTAADERKRCADLLARRAAHLQRMGDEKTAKMRPWRNHRRPGQPPRGHRVGSHGTVIKWPVPPPPESDFAGVGLITSRGRTG